MITGVITLSVPSGTISTTLPWLESLTSETVYSVEGYLYEIDAFDDLSNLLAVHILHEKWRINSLCVIKIYKTCTRDVYEKLCSLNCPRIVSFSLACKLPTVLDKMREEETIAAISIANSVSELNLLIYGHDANLSSRDSCLRSLIATGKVRIISFYSPLGSLSVNHHPYKMLSTIPGVHSIRYMEFSISNYTSAGYTGIDWIYRMIKRMPNILQVETNYSREDVTKTGPISWVLNPVEEQRLIQEKIENILEPRRQQITSWSPVSNHLHCYQERNLVELLFQLQIMQRADIAAIPTYSLLPFEIMQILLFYLLPSPLHSLKLFCKEEKDLLGLMNL